MFISKFQIYGFEGSFFKYIKNVNIFRFITSIKPGYMEKTTFQYICMHRNSSVYLTELLANGCRGHGQNIDLYSFFPISRDYILGEHVPFY